MRQGDVARLLTVAAGYDQRTITDDDIAAWHAALLDFDDLDGAVGAVVEFYREHADRRVQVADVIHSLSPPVQTYTPPPVGVQQALVGWAPPGGNAEQRARFDATVNMGKANTQARRERVLRHPDLAARLCAPPLNYARPEQWNGFVPPRETQAQMADNLRSPDGHPNQAGEHTQPTMLNPSARRAALVAICQEAMAREEGDRDATAAATPG